MIKRINKKLNLSPRRVRNFYSNVIAGMIAGGSIGTILTIIQKFSNITWQMPSLIQIVVVFILFYFLYYQGMNSLSKMTKNKEEIENFNSNLRAGFFASFFIVVLLSIQNVWIRLLIILPLTIIFVLVIYFIAGRRSKT
ncbi:hypothetical protein GOV12_07700 [Candidatus Pacearchaeota archaeon]|nr:hypothetical protein [Candidatus Pacearchaeota archaeon]